MRRDIRSFGAALLLVALVVALLAGCRVADGADVPPAEFVGAAGAAGAVGIPDQPGAPAQCDPTDREGTYRIEVTSIVGDCAATPDGFEASLQRPPGAPPDCEQTDYEVSPSGCSHRVRCREPNGAKHELSVMQLDASGSTVAGRYYFTAPAEECWWDFTAVSGESS